MMKANYDRGGPASGVNIFHLQVFCDLVETCSFSTSAERNRVTQSAVSQQIKSLEDRYSVTFFERGKKKFTITPEGQVFYEAGKRILEIFAGINDSLHTVRNEVAGKLRLATVYSLGLHELPPLLKVYKAKFDQVDVQISYRRSSEVYEDILNDKADLGIVAYPRARRGVIVETFSKDKLVVICPPNHPLAVLKSIRITDLRGLNFIAFEPDLPTRKAVDQMLADRKVNVRTVLELDNVETVKRAVEVDTGISLVPHNAVVEEVRSGQLKALELKDADMIRPMGMVVKRGCTLTPALREFMRVLRSYSNLESSLEKVGNISENAFARSQ